MVTMYDSISLSQIPADAEAVAGYVGGRWPTFVQIPTRWPHARHLSIAVASYQDAECLDVEAGDATNAVAPAWVRRQKARGIKRPVVYTSVSNVAALLRALAAAGIRRSDIRLWTAHYTFHEHLCGPACGFGMPTTADATQWTDRAHGRVLDQSVCSDSFWGIKPRPRLTPYRRWAIWYLGRRDKAHRPKSAPRKISAAWWAHLRADLKKRRR